MEERFIAEVALGYQQLTLDATTPQALTVPNGTTLMLIRSDAQAVRWRDDATNPSATVGYPLPVGVEMRYTANNRGVLRFIGQVTGAVLNVVYYA